MIQHRNSDIAKDYKLVLKTLDIYLALKALNKYSEDVNYYDSLESHKQLFTTIDDKIASFDNDVPQELLKIKQKLDTFPLKYISFDDKDEHLLNLEQYPKNHTLVGKKLHYTFPAQLIKNAQCEYSRYISQQTLKDDIVVNHCCRLTSYRKKVVVCSEFFHLCLCASYFLSTFSIVSTTILNPINLLIVLTAYMTSTYIMFLPEHLKDEEKQNNHNLYHFAFFNLYLVASLLAFGLLTQVFAPASLFLVLAYLFTLLPICAHVYKSILLNNKYNELPSTKLTKMEFFREKIHSCSLFEAKEDKHGLPYFAFKNEEIPPSTEVAPA